jgi:hypothetical protein
MLAHLLAGLPITMEITGTRMQARTFSVVCFTDLPPGSSSKTRYLVKRLRSALPELRIAVGRWLTCGAGRREPADVPGRGRQFHCLSVDRQSELPRRPPGDGAPVTSTSIRSTAPLCNRVHPLRASRVHSGRAHETPGYVRRASTEPPHRDGAEPADEVGSVIAVT